MRTYATEASVSSSRSCDPRRMSRAHFSGSLISYIVLLVLSIESHAAHCSSFSLSLSLSRSVLAVICMSLR